MWDTLKFEAKQFCLSTGLHGYKFLVLSDRTLLERIIWFVIIIVSLITTLTLSLLAAINFDENPTVLVTDSTHFPIWNYPFPAITICSFNKISKKRALHKAAQFKEKLNFTDQEIADNLALLSQIYFNNQDITKSKTKRFQNIRSLLVHNPMNLAQLLRDLSPGCSDIIVKCKWKEEEKRCDTMFEKITTSEGHCCSFNYYAIKNHTFTGKYPGKIPAKPRHVSACGYQTGLEMIVDSQIEDYYAVRVMAYGHKVIIHDSYSYPDWSMESVLVGLGVTLFVGINPSYTFASSDLRSLAIEKRKCYFWDEVNLKRFQNYTYQNCLTECRMNLSLSYCGCIPVIYTTNKARYSEPNPRICSIRDITCLYKYRQRLKSSIPGFEIKDAGPTIEDEYDWSRLGPCECLPDCEFPSYNFQTSQGVLTRQFSDNQRSLYAGVELKNHSVIRFYYNDLVGTRNRRYVSYNWQTLLAYYGGLLGLFLGFNIISGVELIYYFTVKFFYDLTSRAKRNKIKEKVILHFRRGNLTFNNPDIKKKNITEVSLKNNHLPHDWFLN